MHTRINVYCENYGWLFEDLKVHFARLQLSGISVVCTNKPIIEADAWVAIRTNECKLSPVPSKTVVCIHDLKQQSGLYSKDGLRGAVHQTRGIVICHPEQEKILNKSGYLFAEHRILNRPLGALRIFRPTNRKKARFTIGWVGKDHPRKRLNWLISAIECIEYSEYELEVLLVGADLGRAQKEIVNLGIPCSWHNRENTPIEAYPDLYSKMSCLMITGTTEAGPLTLFEALASGIPVVSTAVGWAPWFAKQAPKFVKIAASPEQIAKEVKLFVPRKTELENKQALIAKLGSIWRLESWVKEVVELANSLVKNPISSSDHFSFVNQ